MRMTQNEVVNYYQSSQWLYRLFIYNSSSLGMHFGFWDTQTKNRQEAILNENRSIIELGHITKNMRILDAGCGVGGTAVYIAKQTGATVYGITLDPQQVRLAKQNASKRKLDHLTEFSAQDYTHTGFPDNYFDIVYGIESICYASPKSAFLKEAYRILKPHGKIIVADGYLARKTETAHEKQVIRDFCTAFVLPEFITENEMLSQIKKSNYVNLHHHDKTKQTLQTVDFFNRLTISTSIPCHIAKYIPSKYTQAMYANYLAMVSTKKAYDMEIFTYQIHEATKPK